MKSKFAIPKNVNNRDKNNDFVVGSVTFEPGARTLWHTHPKGQVLIVIEGEGIYQEKGKAARHPTAKYRAHFRANRHRRHLPLSGTPLLLENDVFIVGNKL